jgi:hypothetical protein
LFLLRLLPSLFIVFHSGRYFIKEQCQSDSELEHAAEFIHFACTSEDVNNVAQVKRAPKQMKTKKKKAKAKTKTKTKQNKNKNKNKNKTSAFYERNHLVKGSHDRGRAS